MDEDSPITHDFSMSHIRIILVTGMIISFGLGLFLGLLF